MLRGLIIAPTITLAAYVALLAPVPREAQRPTAYFPIHTGAKWVYVTGDTEVVDVVSDVEKKEGYHLVTVSTIDKDKTVNFARQYKVSAEGLYLVAVPSTEPGSRFTYNPPLCELKTPPAAGIEWTDEIPEIGLVYTRTVGKSERVRVPAGEFDAIPVQRRARFRNGGFPVAANRKHWYVLGIGAVKYEIDGRETVLKSFTPGK